MNLQTLIDKLQESGQIKHSRLVIIKMSARRYAKFLGYSSLDDCPESAFAIGKLARRQKIEQGFGNEKSQHTIRNTKNDISFMLRHAEELNLIKLIPEEFPSLDEKSFGRRKITPKLSPIVSHEETSFGKESYSLPLKKWDENLHLQYNEWLEWVTTPGNKINNIDPFNRAATIDTKTDKMEAFFGFLKNIKKISELDFEMLIDVVIEGTNEIENKKFIKCREQPNMSLLEEFVRWHISRYSGKFTTQAKAVLSVALSLAERFYLLRAIKLEKAELIEKYSLVKYKIKELRNTLIRTEYSPKLTIPKQEKVISQGDLWHAAVQEFPGDNNLISQQAGTIKASNAARALAIMLMLKYPLRSRNLREAKIGRNIFKNSDGKWVIHFVEDEEPHGQLYKKRRNNFESFNHEVTSEIAVYLEKYLKHWHPKLVAQINYVAQENSSSQTQPLETHLFLTSKGFPLSKKIFSKWIERGVFRWFGVRVNPDLIRQIAHLSSNP